MIEETAHLTAVLQERRKAAQNGEALRGVHPKSHGCVNATFTIKEKLRRRLRNGLFAEPGKTYKAKIRYSNATTAITPDMAPGPDGVMLSESRGMAIKVLGIKGKMLVKDGRRNAQDFLLINTPAFAFSNVRDYLRATHALMADPAGVDGKLFFLPLQMLQAGLLDPATGKMTPVGAKEPPEFAQMRAIFKNSIFKNFTARDLAATVKSFGVVQQIQAATVRNPLETPYFTAAPLHFGGSRVARFAVFPEEAPKNTKPITAAEYKRLGKDFLAKALAKSMASGDPVRLSFQAQVLHPIEVKGRVSELVEDAAVAWDDEEFGWDELATITIDPADQPADLVDACKADRFTPWHSLAAHKPLGGINRLRQPVYVTSGNTRLGKKTVKPK